MIRVVLINLLFLLLPTLLYFSYVYIRRRDRPGEQVLSNAPIFWLLSLGVAMMIASLVIFGKWEGGAPSGKYVPPRLKDGVIIPGHVE
jgi:hypothetical protein